MGKSAIFKSQLQSCIHRLLDGSQKKRLLNSEPYLLLTVVPPPLDPTGGATPPSSDMSGHTPVQEPLLPPFWLKCFSNTHQREYYFNVQSGDHSWMSPPHQHDSSGSSKRRRLEAPATARPVVAIIVPFRDLHVEQKRSLHLQKFIPHMTDFLSLSSIPFRIYIVEQSSDGRKFNRGKLLNIGYDIAKKDGCRVFVFHDVDLLPSPELLPYYTDEPAPDKPVHIARVWNRYSLNLKYFGGVVTFSNDQFVAMNGYPNNFWGWGGEDDELYKRLERCKYEPAAPSAVGGGSLLDLEDMTLEDKLSFLRENNLWKCMNKDEVLGEHEQTWASNGIKGLKYVLLATSSLGSHCVKLSVDIMMNNHWTDVVCGLDDKQRGKSVAELKIEYSKMTSLKKR